LALRAIPESPCQPISYLPRPFVAYPQGFIQIEGQSYRQPARGPEKIVSIIAYGLHAHAFGGNVRSPGRPLYLLVDG
jgi:hypothetical protein